MSKEDEAEEFSPEEAKSRFDALLFAAAHCPPMSQKELQEKNRKGELPEIHELSTAELWRRAAYRAQEARQRQEAKKPQDITSMPLSLLITRLREHEIMDRKKNANQRARENAQPAEVLSAVMAAMGRDANAEEAVSWLLELADVLAEARGEKDEP